MTTRREKCCVCGVEWDAWVFEDDTTEPCDSCMNPEIPQERGEYRDSYGNDYGWQDSTFPNEY